MENKRLTVALLFGGRSAEHEVSLRSARSIFEALDQTKYQVIPVLITREGAWLRKPAHPSSFDLQADHSQSERLLLSPDPQHKGFLVANGTSFTPMTVDIVFPVLHGTYGEDGTVQGLLELANIPYVGCGVLASAVGMDKVVMKAAFKEAGLKVGPFFWFLKYQWENQHSTIMTRLKKSNFPIFIKPANLGSSVGITRVKDVSGFEAAVNLAFLYDRKVLVEDEISGRELEVSVLGNDDPKASLPGEVIPQAEFYDYEEKYIRDTTKLMIPADLPSETVKAVQAAAISAFKAVDASGLARVDMFLTPGNEVVINEINTLPGFTSISMYPKLWEATGLPYGKLIDTLINLALERHEFKQSIKTDRKL